MVKKYLIYETNIVILQDPNEVCAKTIQANRLLSTVNLFNIDLLLSDIKVMSIFTIREYTRVLSAKELDWIGWKHEWNKHTPNLESIYKITHTIWKNYE